MPQISVEEALQLAGNSIEKAISVLWDLDENRLTPDVDYTLDLQRPTESSKKGVATRRPLFRHFSPDVWTRTTYGKFRHLLERYDPRAISVDTTDDEADFICTIVKTPCLRFVRQWLATHAHPSVREQSFSSLLLKIWFSEHSKRQTLAQATGFQHIFCGEFRRSKGFTGLHNFLSVYLEEAKGTLHYMGYRKSSCDVQDTSLQKQRMLEIRFRLHGRQKRLSSMFFGVSPEFEVGLYSLMILARKSNVTTSFGSYRVSVKAVAKHGKVITAFPLLLDVAPANPKRTLDNQVQKAIPAFPCAKDRTVFIEDAQTDVVCIDPVPQKKRLFNSRATQSRRIVQPINVTSQLKAIRKRKPLRLKRGSQLMPSRPRKRVVEPVIDVDKISESLAEVIEVHDLTSQADSLDVLQPRETTSLMSVDEEYVHDLT